MLWMRTVGGCPGDCPTELNEHLAKTFPIMYYTVCLFYHLGLLEAPFSSKCHRYHSDLIYMPWCYLKLYRCWAKVIDTINMFFQTNVFLDPKPCLSGILEGNVLLDNTSSYLEPSSMLGNFYCNIRSLSNH